MTNFFKFLVSCLLVISASCNDDSGDVVFNITNNPISNGEVNENTTEIGGIMTSDLTLDGVLENTTYLLESPLIMESGTTLTITPGTIIKSDAGTNGYIAIQQGATINARGTASNPIVMTSFSNNPASGDWGGLVILGRATINSGQTATSEVGNFSYGGTDDTDNSGTLEYLRLEYTGAAIDSDSEFNGISFYAVGSETTVNHIQVHTGSDDGVEFFGGTVNVDNLIVTNSGDDSVDWTEGWRGTLTDVYIQLEEGVSEKGIEADGNEDNNAATPFSSPTINNITIIGPGSSSLNDDGENFEAIRLRRGTQALFNNVFIQGVAEGIDIDDPLTVDHVTNNITRITNITFQDVTTPLNSQENSAGLAINQEELLSGIGNGTKTEVAQWGSGWSFGVE